MSTRLRPLAVCVLAIPIALAAGEAPPVVPEYCALCPGDPGVPVVNVGSVDLLAIADAIADANEDRLAQIDVDLREGAYGQSDSPAAASAARVAAKTSLLNVYHFLYGLASDPSRAIQADAAALEDILQRFTEPALFPIARLRRLRAGGGQVCLRYDLSETASGETVFGGLRHGYAVKEETIDRRRRRVLSLAYRSAAVSHYEVLLTEHYSFSVSKTLIPGPPSAYELFAFRNVQGGWIRRWGLHRPTAFAFWTSPPGLSHGTPARSRTAGICVYIPHLRLVLPILPDIGLDDLRPLHLASPFLRVDYVRGPKRPPWLLVDDSLSFRDWASVGSPPPALSELFPDL